MGKAQNIAAPDASASEEQIRLRLKELAEEISTGLSALDAARSKELLSDFVSDLFLSQARRSQMEDRRQKQAEGIAAAKARGVRFGRTASPVPDNFDQVYQAWRGGDLSLKKAAEACGIARGTFYNMAMRREQTAS